MSSPSRGFPVKRTAALVVALAVVALIAWLYYPALSPPRAAAPAPPPVTAAPAGCPQATVVTGSSITQVYTAADMRSVVRESPQAAAAGAEVSSVSLTGPAAGGVRIHATGKLHGVAAETVLVLRAAPPNLAATVEQGKLGGVLLPAQRAADLGASLFGYPLDAIPLDFSVDSVYACSASAGPQVMVVQGHR